MGALSEGLLPVIDGDDVEWQRVNHRLSGYDTPETKNFRSRINKDLERLRGNQATYRLQYIIENARSVLMIPWDRVVFPNRPLSTLVVDGHDVSDIATQEGWGVAFNRRKSVDWGDPRLSFPNLPVPPWMDQAPRPGGKRNRH